MGGNYIADLGPRGPTDTVSAERDSCTCLVSTVGQEYWVRISNFGGGAPPSKRSKVDFDGVHNCDSADFREFQKRFGTHCP